MSMSATRMVLPVPAVVSVLLLVVGGALVEAGSSAGRPVVVVAMAVLVSVLLLFWRKAAGGIAALGVWLGVGAWLASLTPDTMGPSAGQCLALGIAGVVLFLFGLRVGRRPSTRATVAQMSERSDRNDGVASRWQLLRHASGWPVRRKASVLRPSLRQVPFYKRRRVPLNELATKLATVGHMGIWSSIEDVTVRFGGPRVGKTGELACRIVDAPGAVIATSTRTDLIELTDNPRRDVGPTYVFNPSGMGDRPSTITFNPLVGCEDPVAASDRAGDLLAAVSAPGSGSDSAYWTEQAQRVLATLMHAAAIENAAAVKHGAEQGPLSMRDVLAWVADPDGSRDEIQRYLRSSPEPSFVQDSLQFLTTNDRTRSSICSTVMPALGWLTNPNAVAAATGGGFDVEQLLAERGTVYMLGAEEAKTAPLVTALTGHIARQARAIAATMPSGRLDPPLTLALDEAALICPVPLDRWTADMGGRNITIHIAAQSRAQLEAKFGDKAARAILNNTATLLLFGGTKDADDLQAFSTLIGERAEDVQTIDETTGNVSTSNRRVAILSPDAIARLEPGQVVIVRRFMPVAIGRVQMVWKRRDLRWRARQRKAVQIVNEWREGIGDTYLWVMPRVAAAVEAAGPALAAGRARLIRSALVMYRVIQSRRNRRAVTHPTPVPLPYERRGRVNEAEQVADGLVTDIGRGDEVASVTSISERTPVS